MSLKDQLLKAGLVNKKQAKKVESNSRKLEHDAKKNSNLANQIESQKQNELKAIEEEKIRRQELDRELNKKRDAFILQRENMYRAVQSINSNSLNEKNATEKYFFAENNFVRKVTVSPWQREMLARGKYGIARIYDDVDDFTIIPLATAQLLQKIYPEKLIVLHNEIDDNVEIEIV